MRVVMTVSKRPEYLEQTLDSWAKVRGIRELEEFIFMVEPTPAIYENTKLITNWAYRNKVPTSVVFNEEINGVLHNPYAGLQRCFDAGSTYAILAEEDLIVSDDILEWHKFAGAKYYADDSVGAVCSFNNNESYSGSEDEYYLAPAFKVWIWGTWSDRWEGVIEPTWDHAYTTYSGFPGNWSGWDWNLNKRVFPEHNMQCVFPAQSRSLSIGLYGVHSTPGIMETSDTFEDHRESVTEWVEVQGVTYPNS